jgi:lysophospholipase L1-like esterase
VSTDRRSLPGLLATGLVALALTALAGCGGGAAPAPEGAVYAALGDSDSAGAGIAPIADADCDRSRVNFGALVAKKLGYTSFEDVSCVGAMTTHLLRPQLDEPASNDPQLDVVGSRTELVTLTIGLNDDKLAYGLLAACLSASGEPSTVCRQVIDASPSTTAKQLSAAADRVKEALQLIKHKAPKARVVLVGYPRYFADSGSCPDRVPMVEAMVPKVRSALKTVNEEWKQAAASVGADYIDTWALSEDHDVCSDDPWVNGATEARGEAAALHPFSAFHRAVADAIVALVKGS